MKPESFLRLLAERVTYENHFEGSGRYWRASRNGNVLCTMTHFSRAKKQTAAPRRASSLPEPIPASEAWLYRNKDALASVRTGLREAARGEVRDLGSFANWAQGGFRCWTKAGSEMRKRAPHVTL